MLLKMELTEILKECIWRQKPSDDRGSLTGLTFLCFYFVLCSPIRSSISIVLRFIFCSLWLQIIFLLFRLVDKSPSFIQ